MQFTTKMIDNRIFIKYSEQSQQPPLLMLMGYSGTTDSWTDEFLRQIAGTRPIIAIDLPGTGRSTRDLTANDLSYEANIKDVESVLSDLGIKRFHLLGYSYGGTVAMSLMGPFEDRLVSVILVATTLGGKNYAPPPMERLIALGKPAGNTVLEKTATIWKVCLGEDRFPDHQKKMVELVEKQGDALTPGWVLKEQLKNYMQFDFADAAATFKIPVLVVTGSADPLTPAQNSYNIARLFTDTKLIEFEDGRHMPHLESPDQFADAILNHLSRSEANRS